MNPISWNKDSVYIEITSVNELPFDFGPLCGMDMEISPLKALDVLTSIPYSIQICDRPGRAWLVKGEEKSKGFLKELFSRDYKFIMHNAKTDLAVYENAGAKPRADDDTMLLSFIVNPNDKHGLKTQAAKRLFINHPEWSREVYSQPEYFKRYACGDAELMMLLYPILKQQVNAKAYGLEMAVLPVLMHMERCGLNVDLKRVQELLGLFEQSIAIVKRKIFALAGCEFELDSHAQVADVVYGKMGVECKKKTRPTVRHPNGQRSTSKLAFRGLEHHDIVRLVELYRRLEKKRGTYVAPLPNYLHEDGRVHTEILQHVTPCLTETALIQTNRGLLKISAVNVGDTVMGRHGMTRVKEAWKVGMREVFRLKTRRGFELEGTGHHPVLLARDPRLDNCRKDKWLGISGLNKSDWVRLYLGGPGSKVKLNLVDDIKTSRPPRNKIRIPKMLTEELAEFIGYLSADGYLRDDGIGMCFNQADGSLREYFKNKGLKLFNCEGKLYDRPDSLILIFNSVKLSKFMERLKVWEDLVPTAIKIASSAVRGGYLRGYWEGDGGVTVKNGKCSIRVKSVMENRMREQQVLMASMGYYVSRSTWRDDSGFKGGLRHELRVIGGDSQTRYKQEIGFLTAKKNQKSVYRAGLGVKLRDGFVRDRIKIIESVGEKEVWDLETEDGTFVANGLLVHNTLRLASTRPNLMNQPIKAESAIEKKLTIREVFIPSEGHYFIGADFSQIEFRLMIFSSRSVQLIRRLDSGEDFHVTTGADVLRDGVPRAEIGKAERDDAKTFNYALCLDKDTTVYVPEGLKCIGKLRELDIIDDGSGNWVAVTGFEEQEEQEGVEIHCKYGVPVSQTLNHVFPIVRQGKAVFSPAAGIIPGDYLLTPRRAIQFKDVLTDPEFDWLLGYKRGDGSWTGKLYKGSYDGICYYAGRKDMDILTDKIKSLGLRSKIHKHDNGECWRVQVWNRPYARDVLEKEKALLLGSGLRDWLSGLLQADGHSQRNSSQYVYSSSDYALICFVAELASSLGCWIRIGVRVQCNKRAYGYGKRSWRLQITPPVRTYFDTAIFPGVDALERGVSNLKINGKYTSRTGLTGILRKRDLSLNEVEMVLPKRVSPVHVSVEKPYLFRASTYLSHNSYGMDEGGYRARKNCSREESHAVMTRFNREYDGLPQWFAQERMLAIEKGMSRTFLGPLRVLEDLHSSDQKVRDRALRNAINDQIQGGAAQIFKIGLIRLYRRKPEWLKMLVPVHDEVLCEVPNEHPSEEVVPIMKELEVDLGAYGKYPIEITKGDCWSRCQKIA